MCGHPVSSSLNPTIVVARFIYVITCMRQPDDDVEDKSANMLSYLGPREASD